MKWTIFFILILVITLFTASMLAVGTRNKESLNYNAREIEDVEDVVDFLEECKTKFGMNCEKLLLDKIALQSNSHTSRWEQEAIKRLNESTTNRITIISKGLHYTFTEIDPSCIDKTLEYSCNTGDKNNG